MYSFGIVICYITKWSKQEGFKKMGKTRRRRDHNINGGVMMQEKAEREFSKEWHEERKKEKQLQQRLRKIKNK